MFISIINEDDIAGVLDIYTPYIVNTAVTFEYEVPEIETFKKRIKNYTSQYPWLVMKDGNNIAGYAYASPYRERSAYQWVAECSIYINNQYKKKGVGTQLYTALLELLKAQGIHRLYALITIPNDASVLFHEKIGFKYFATFKNVGYKNSKWHDVGWWEITLHSTTTPSALIPFSQFSKKEVSLILEKYTN